MQSAGVSASPASSVGTRGVTLPQEDPDADHVPFGMLIPVQTDLGQQIVPSGIRRLALEFDHIDVHRQVKLILQLDPSSRTASAASALA